MSRLRAIQVQRLRRCAALGWLSFPAPQTSRRWWSCLREKLVPPATVGFDAGADAHLLYELERLPIKLVAGRLTESRNDFAEIAGRLHTRVDVEWSDLL